MSLLRFRSSRDFRLLLLLVMPVMPLADDSGDDGGQFWVSDVMWRVRRLPPVSQKQPASKPCDVAVLQIKIPGRHARQRARVWA
jgi:hypothetical protein